jgi:hypothetical protein
MTAAQIVTIKPQDGIVEYQIVEVLDGQSPRILSHGHQLTIELTAEQTGAELQAAVEVDASEKGLLA